MVNPFETDSPMQNLTAKLPGLAGEAAQQAKEEVMSDAGALFEATRSFQQSASAASRSRNVRWQKKLKQYGGQLLRMIGDFIVRAVQLAIAKFVLELCAMIINTIMQSLTKMGNAKMDITSPNVYYSGNGFTPALATPPAGNPYPGGGAVPRSPFETGLYGNSGNGVSPW